MEAARGRFIAIQMQLLQDGWADGIPKKIPRTQPWYAVADEPTLYSEAKNIVANYGTKWLQGEGRRTGVPAKIQDWRSVCLGSAQAGTTKNCDICWHRGFPEQWTISWDNWLKYGNDLLKAWPITRIEFARQDSLNHRMYFRDETINPDLTTLVGNRQFSVDGQRWVDMNGRSARLCAMEWVSQGWPKIHFLDSSAR